MKSAYEKTVDLFYLLKNNKTTTFNITVTTEFLLKCSNPIYESMREFAFFNLASEQWMLNETNSIHIAGQVNGVSAQSINGWDMILFNALYKKANKALTL